ncbi:DUF1080 domain-containing protein [Arenibacter sp. F26102]|uniref:3-keto-disaccharide hydrolase n=1 Tax=Arenibacter sp. F26102 TaxID=2926416 RepID=UPI001FF49B61|nr:DUF1080 domain-containing protein [Arenibacter sp. F26102]MCK0146292.1 DUF1080 domain-containing protein [Arenibacter sp. F26102]
MKNKFKMCLMALNLLLASTTLSFAQEINSIEGRWDMVISQEGEELPSWLEIRHSGSRTLVGRFVYAMGSARPIAEVKMKDGKFSFAIPPQWENGDTYMEFEGSMSGDVLKGSMLYTNGQTYNWVATRAPKLEHSKNPKWGKPIKLFNGKDLSGWQAMGENQWIVDEGELKSPKSGSNLVSEQKFDDFKLHLEFKYPKGSNSGVYLRGRYEVQITDSQGAEPSDVEYSGVYGFLTPSEVVAKAAGEWQEYDITLIGRRVTVVANGTTVISDQIIPGITGGALDSKEGEPGPLYFQGDHGPIEFRNIVVTPRVK